MTAAMPYLGSAKGRRKQDGVTVRTGERIQDFFGGVVVADS